MFKVLENFRLSIGMDVNEFYSAFITLISIVIPAVVSFFKCIINIGKNNLWLPYKKREGDFFFLIVLMIEVGLVAVATVVFALICRVLYALGIRFYILYGFIYGVLIAAMRRFILRLKFVRIRLLGEKKKSWLVYVSMVIISLMLWTFILEIDNSIFCVILFSVYFLVEIAGMIAFKGRYILYEYSCVIFYLRNGDSIDCKDISKITIKGSSIIIAEEKKQIILMHEEILKAEYYGEEKIQLVGEGKKGF